MLANLFGFTGRIGRGGWWLARLAIVLVIALLIASALALHVEDKSAANNNTLFLIILSVCIFLICAFDLCSTVKRYHDRGKSGWWYLIALIPFGGLWQMIECGFMSGDDGDNHYGPPPGSARSAAALDAELDTMRKSGLSKLDDNYMENYARALAEKEAIRQSVAAAATPILGGGTGRPAFGKR